QAWFNRVVLSNRVLVWFGLISFPLYLWHWPLLSFARIIESETPTRGIRLAAIALAILLAWLTYRLIEKPLRFGKQGRAKTIVLLVLMGVVGFAGYNDFKRDGLGFRFPGGQFFSDYFENSLPEQRYFGRLGLAEKYRDECNFYDMERYKARQGTVIPRESIARSCFARDALFKKAVLIWGDSHAQQLNYGVTKYLPSDWQVLQVASSGCAPALISETSTSNWCEQSNWFALKAIKEAQPDVVVVAQNLGHNLNTMSEIAMQLTKMGVKKVIFTGPSPHWTTYLPKLVLKKLWFNTPRRTYIGIDKKVLDDNADLQKGFKQTDTVKFVNLINLFCNDQGCLTYIGEDIKVGITTWDYGHLTPISSEYLARALLVKLIVE
ncbi:MAG: SGNH hydrolase domain-containing protein, partial [Gallionella sp.]